MSPQRGMPTSSPLRRREFRLYFMGNMTSNVGSWLQNVAIGVYMQDLTHSSFWVGMSQAGLAIPVLLFALPAGALADRRERIVVLRRAQELMTVLAVLLTVLVATGRADRLTVTAISFGMGFGLAIAIPAMQSMVPTMVPDSELADAIQLNALTFNVARTLGPTLAALVIATLGATWAFGLNAVSFVPLIVALALIGRPPFPRGASGEGGGSRAGLAYAWHNVPTRAMLLAVVAIAVALDPITTLSPALAHGYGLATAGAGWIVAGWGGGAVAMLVFGRPLLRAATHHGLGWLGLAVLSVGMIGLGLAPSLLWALVSGVVAGAGYITATMVFTTAIQRSVPESLRGRVSALWTIAFLGPRAVSAVIDGALADRFGPHTATVWLAAVTLVAAVFLRRIEAAEGDPVAPPV